MSFLNDVLNIFIKYYPQLLTGVGNTVLIALTSTVAGLALGLLTGVVRTAPMSKNPILRALHKLLNAIIAIYVEIFRGTPMMVQSMVIYWAMLSRPAATRCRSSRPASSSCPSTPARTWPRSSAAASFPSTAASLRAPCPSE